jgi:UDP-N-acetylmuramoylalanine--D-glutamate ligase
MVGGLGAFTSQAMAAHLKSDQKRIVVFNMHGGLSQLESWDPKPGTETGGPFLAIPTSVPGIHISELLPLTAMRLQGLHNAANALAALAMCDALGLPRGPVLEALETFGGLPHRAQWVADVGGVRFVNDSKGTNVGATLAAVSGMGGPLVLIAGGDGKNQDFAQLRVAFRGKVRHAVLIGRDAPRLADTLEGICTTERAADMPSAVRAARAAAQAGDTVLLSPACASLDMFRDYTHRGDEFAAAVRSLAG